MLQLIIYAIPSVHPSGSLRLCKMAVIAKEGMYAKKSRSIFGPAILSIKLKTERLRCISWMMILNLPGGQLGIPVQNPTVIQSPIVARPKLSIH